MTRFSTTTRAGCGKAWLMKEIWINLYLRADPGILSGYSKGLPSKAAASEKARRTFRYVDALSDARTPLAGFFSILLMLMWVFVGLWISDAHAAADHEKLLTE